MIEQLLALHNSAMMIDHTVKTYLYTTCTYNLQMIYSFTTKNC